jgi:4-hydroxymandelate oxidase
MGASPLPPLIRIPPDIVALTDYEHYAQERMTKAAWAFMSSGAADELTLVDNQAAFRRLKLNQRVLADMAEANTRLELFGDRFEYPILLAPVAYHKLAHQEGELATVLGASAMRAGMVLSTQASVDLEQVARSSRSPLWFQLYMRDSAFTKNLVRRVESAGYRALVITVDAAVNGVRNRQQRAEFFLPDGIVAVNLRGLNKLSTAQTAQAGASPLFGGPLLAQAPGWNELGELIAFSRLPVLVKGITTPQDALLALECGASGIIVSNHGGRTLDTAPAAIDVLPAVVDVVKKRVPILLDGGIRRGTDVLKALALGATATLIGRPYIYGLATAGAAGVAHVLQILRSELEIAMAQTGRATLAEIDASILWQAASQNDH